LTNHLHLLTKLKILSLNENPSLIYPLGATEPERFVNSLCLSHLDHLALDTLPYCYYSTITTRLTELEKQETDRDPAVRLRLVNLLKPLIS
jgi:hypothetical protein